MHRLDCGKVHRSSVHQIDRGGQHGRQHTNRRKTPGTNFQASAGAPRTTHATMVRMPFGSTDAPVENTPATQCLGCKTHPATGGMKIRQIRGSNAAKHDGLTPGRHDPVYQPASDLLNKKQGHSPQSVKPCERHNHAEQPTMVLSHREPHKGMRTLSARRHWR